MVIGKIVYCDFCGQACFPDDFTTIHIEASGEIHAFSYHNRHNADCLAQKLTSLRQQFLVAPASD